MPILLFDIDGTLLNSGGAGQAAMEAALAQAFNITAPTTGISVAGRTDRAIISDLFSFHGIEATVENHRRMISAYLAHLPSELARRRGLILPGVVSLLERLASSSPSLLGLLTGNLQRGAELKLNHFGLMHHFRGGGFGDRHRHRDDVARDAIACIRRLHPDALNEPVWVIGDTPADVQCGRAIGASVLAVATGMYSAEQLESSRPDCLVEDFSAVDRMVDLLT